MGVLLHHIQLGDIVLVVSSATVRRRNSLPLFFLQWTLFYHQVLIFYICSSFYLGLELT